MKKLVEGLLFFLLFVALTACVGSAAESEGGVVEATPIAVEGEESVETADTPVEAATVVSEPDSPVEPEQDTVIPPDTIQAQEAFVVESVEILTLESMPVQIHAIVKGHLTDTCTTLSGHQVEWEAQEIKLNLLVEQSVGQACVADLVPFEETIPLEVSDLSPGEYLVTVNGVSEILTLTPEMIGQSPAPAAEEAQSEGIDRVKIYLVALEDKGESGPEVGCGDSLVAVEREIAPTKAPLRAAMQELLSLDEQYYGQSGFYNALYQSDLQIENITLDDQGTATIYLTGTYALAEVCDNPRFEAQLVETARQFSTVNEVSIFINGTPLKEVLSLAYRSASGSIIS